MKHNVGRVIGIEELEQLDARISDREPKEQFGYKYTMTLLWIVWLGCGACLLMG